MMPGGRLEYREARADIDRLTVLAAEVLRGGSHGMVAIALARLSAMLIMDMRKEGRGITCAAYFDLIDAELRNLELREKLEEYEP